MEEKEVLSDAVNPEDLEEKVATEGESINEETDSNEDFKELISNIDAHFLSVRNLLKFNKDKDQNISKLTTELQMYRDGLETKLFKSIALSLIGLREDCKKSVREFKDRGLSLDEAKKYLNYLVYDYEDLLANLNIVIEEEKIFYNGKLVELGFDKKINVCSVDEFVLPEVPKLAAEDKQSIIQYLVDVENYIVEVLKSNSNLDKILKVYIENASLYEQGIHQVILYPVVNEIAKLYGVIKNQISNLMETLDEVNTVEVYVATAQIIIDGLDLILSKCNIVIESFVSEQYDPLKHRLLKVVYSDNQAENGKAINIYSDCYLMDGRVIYPQKVDVIKYKENN